MAYFLFSAFCVQQGLNPAGGRTESAPLRSPATEFLSFRVGSGSSVASSCYRDIKMCLKRTLQRAKQNNAILWAYRACGVWFNAATGDSEGVWRRATVEGFLTSPGKGFGTSQD